MRAIQNRARILPNARILLFCFRGEFVTDAGRSPSVTNSRNKLLIVTNCVQILSRYVEMYQNERESVRIRAVDDTHDF